MVIKYNKQQHIKMTGSKKGALYYYIVCVCDTRCNNNMMGALLHA